MATEFAQWVRSRLSSRAGRYPGRIALADVTNGATLNWRELYDQASRVAGSLPDGPGKLYLLPSANSLEKIVLWLGAWMRGAAVLNVDTAYLPADVVAALLETAQPMGELSLAASGAALRPIAARQAEMPAGTVLVNCTSGTTGMPKLVYQSGAALQHNGRVSAGFMELEEGEPCLEVRGMNWYSAQILSLMPFLLVGTQLHVAPGFSASALPGWLDRYRIRFVPMVPGMVRIMLGLTDALPASLTRFSCSSSELAASVWERAESTWGVPLVNLYGSSELGWICGSDAASRQIDRVGFPADGVRVEVVQEPGAAPDRSGRVMAASPYAALATRLVSDPLFQPMPATIDTQDLGRFDAGGRLAVTGRADDMILRGGVNIHPRDIERHIERIPGVKQAVAFGVEDATYGAVVGCVFSGAPAVQADDLAMRLATELPPAWQPVYWWKLDTIPLGANGKISRRQLRQQLTESLPPRLGPRSAHRSAAPRPEPLCARSGASRDAGGTEG